MKIYSSFTNISRHREHNRKYNIVKGKMTLIKLQISLKNENIDNSYGVKLARQRIKRLVIQFTDANRKSLITRI